MLTDEMKKNIDAMSYREMLSKWRFSPAGDPMFSMDHPEIGAYFTKVMEEKKQADPAGAVAASKAIGW